jgi:hypothetical protein
MSSGSRKKRQSVAQTAGGIMFGFEQQVFRNAPPPEEVVHQARPDLSVPTGDGSFVTLELPDDALPEDPPSDDPWAGIEDELTDLDDPWADYAAEAGSAASGSEGDPAAESKPEGS